MSDEVRSEEELPNGISAAISKLMEHPELISMVASTLGRDTAAASPQSASQSSVAPSEDKSPSDGTLAAFMPMLSKLSGTLGRDGQKNAPHAQLLCALKPYVSENRRTAIDYILKLSQISELMGGIK